MTQSALKKQFTYDLKNDIIMQKDKKVPYNLCFLKKTITKL